jgi:hypothetical protein
LAKKKKNHPDQQSLFSPGGKTTKKCAPSKKVKIPTSPVVREKVYAGLDIVELTEKIEEYSRSFGAEYVPNRWNGTADIRLVGTSFDQVKKAIIGLDVLSTTYGFTAKAVVHFKSDKKFDVKYVVNIIVPGVLDTSGDPFANRT